jgi:hypothetical protein
MVFKLFAYQKFITGVGADKKIVAIMYIYYLYVIVRNQTKSAEIR